jgi:hypothetical protein
MQRAISDLTHQARLQAAKLQGYEDLVAQHQLLASKFDKLHTSTFNLNSMMEDYHKRICHLEQRPVSPNAIPLYQRAEQSMTMSSPRPLEYGTTHNLPPPPGFVPVHREPSFRDSLGRVSVQSTERVPYDKDAAAQQDRWEKEELTLCTLSTASVLATVHKWNKYIIDEVAPCNHLFFPGYPDAKPKQKVVIFNLQKFRQYGSSLIVAVENQLKISYGPQWLTSPALQVRITDIVLQELREQYKTETTGFAFLNSNYSLEFSAAAIELRNDRGTPALFQTYKTHAIIWHGYGKLDTANGRKFIAFWGAALEPMTDNLLNVSYFEKREERYLKHLQAGGPYLRLQQTVIPCFVADS